ncbi:helix-turn-helix transcriptional regulator [Candidatus Peregrinibacteria bacterium]|nr:MAG: helix-turn-helix transcriptional regulator [Candidatus Peregrinibacteria bacterium]
MASHQKIIARIKAVREDLGWSQAELSRQMNQASNTIQKIESGFIKNPEKYLPQIAETTKKPLSYFYGEDNPELTQFAEKAKKFDALMDLIKESGILGGISNSSVNSNGGEKNVTVGGNGNNVNVNGDAGKIIEEIMKKDHEEHQLILKILELEKDEKDKLFQLYEVVKKKDNK